MPGSIIAISNTAWSILNFRLDLLLALKGAGYDVIAVAPPDEFTPEIEKHLRFIPLAHLDRQGKNPVRDILLTREFRRIIRDEAPDLLLTFTIKPNIYGAIAGGKAGIPTIANVTGLGSAFAENGHLRRLVTRLYRRAFRNVSTAVFQNEEDRSIIVDSCIISADKTALVPGSGVNLDRFTPAPLPGSGDRVRFLMVSRMLWDKGVNFFVDAASIIKETRPDAEFILLGPVDTKSPSAIPLSILEQWDASGAVSYLGAVRDVRDHIAGADVVVMPSHYREGTPRSLLEAMAMGRPIITTDVAGCRDTVVDGTTGFMIPPMDRDALVDAMQRMITMGENERAAMGQAGLERAREHYDQRIVIDTYFRLIADTIG